jgi:hypothetical protein
MTWSFCRACLEKQRQIDDLKEEIVRLKGKLRHQERTAQEGFFGSSTPSSKVPVKPDTLAERQARRGGAKVGHRGHGRKSVAEGQAHRVERVRVGPRCPDCACALTHRGTRRRTVTDCHPVKMEKTLYLLERKECPKCGRWFSARAPGVFPKGLYGNQLLTHVAVQHYLYGVPLGQLERQTGVGFGSLIEALHQVARRLQDVPGKLAAAYREAPVKHADETGWRTDGQNGYAWLFATPEISVFRFRKTRRAEVAREVLGETPLPGTLVVDRYSAYAKSPCKLQYCYAHLLRTVEDMEKDFPETVEIKSFVATLAPLLAGAMTLRTLPLRAPEYYRQAARLKSRIIEVTGRDAHHPAIQKVQDIFREHGDRLYHWADDRSVPADNNLAERDLRHLVIARKVSFGSQSDAGAKTRETLMSILDTMKKRNRPVAETFKAGLDKLAENPALDPYSLLFPPDTS